jgi:putative ATP-dependent endonuclease of the OLD family
MKIRHVQIERFRGIRELSWRVGGDFACLVGPGDSTKTTILDAIEFALSPRWNIPFDDSDFYDAVTAVPILITVTVGELPEEFKSDAKYGYLSRGWAVDGTLHDEPVEGDELVLSIQLRVDPSLEQAWTVVNDRNPEGKPISAKDREKLGCARLGDFLDRHFSWGRGSILSRLTGEADSLSSILAEAGRAARDAVTDVPPEKLQNLYDAAQEAKRIGAQFGVAAKTDYRPQLDLQSVSVGVGGISLHDGDVPLRRAGLGTRRLLAVAMQREVAKDGGVTLIDEVEQGLEPHRIRHLLRIVRGAEDTGQRRHVLMTTHAPVVLEELRADQLRVVRSKDGVTQVLAAETVLQPIIRKTSGAFLARKVLVCEGKTEIGLCRRLDLRWSEGGQSFALSGVAIADGGGGNQAPMIAKAFADLGYDVALLGDSDIPLKPHRATLEAAGATVILWDGGVALEQRIVLDLPWDGVAAVVESAIANWSDQSIRDSVAGRLGVATARLVGPPVDWIGLGLAEADLREAIGAAAKDQKGGWFKRVDLAECLAGIVIEHGAAIAKTDLCRKIVDLKEWAHDNA